MFSALPEDLTDLVFSYLSPRELTYLCETALRPYVFNVRYSTIRLVDFPLSRMYDVHVHEEDQKEAVLSWQTLPTFMRQNSDVFRPNRLQIVNAKALRCVQVAYPHLVSAFRSVEVLNYTECDCIATADFTYQSGVSRITSLTLEKDSEELRPSELYKSLQGMQLTVLNLRNVSVDFSSVRLPKSLTELHLGYVRTSSPSVDLSYLSLQSASFDGIFFNFSLPDAIRELTLSNLQPIYKLSVHKYTRLSKLCVHSCTFATTSALEIDFPPKIRDIHLKDISLMRSYELPIVVINGRYTQEKKVCFRLPHGLQSFLLTRKQNPLPSAEDGRALDLQSFFVQTEFPQSLKTLVLRGFSGLMGKWEFPTENLEHLVVSRMSLTSLCHTNIAKLKCLKKLSLEGNALAKLHWEMLPASVRFLDASKNSLAHVDLSVSKINHLCLGENSLTHLRKEYLPPMLDKLWVENNPLNQPSFPSSLKTLLLSGTGVTIDQDLLNFVPNLQILHIEHCIVPEGIVLPKSLERLWMSSCHIKDTKNITWPSSLEYLDISNNTVSLDLCRLPNSLRVLHACNVLKVKGEMKQIREARFNGVTGCVSGSFKKMGLSMFGNESFHTYYKIPNVGTYYASDRGCVLVTEGEILASMKHYERSE